MTDQSCHQAVVAGFCQDEMAKPELQSLLRDAGVRKKQGDRPKIRLIFRCRQSVKVTQPFATGERERVHTPFVTPQGPQPCTSSVFFRCIAVITGEQLNRRATFAQGVGDELTPSVAAKNENPPAMNRPKGRQGQQPFRIETVLRCDDAFRAYATFSQRAFATLAHDSNPQEARPGFSGLYQGIKGLLDGIRAHENDQIENARNNLCQCSEQTFMARWVDRTDGQQRKGQGLSSCRRDGLAQSPALMSGPRDDNTTPRQRQARRRAGRSGAGSHEIGSKTSGHAREDVFRPLGAQCFG